jgi:hypothetical protein
MTFAFVFLQIDGCNKLEAKPKLATKGYLNILS